jgi:hypothetical protein
MSALLNDEQLNYGREIATSALLQRNRSVFKDKTISPLLTISAKKPLAEKQKPNCLPLAKIQLMIRRFLIEKQMTFENLAKELGVATHKLTELNITNYEALAAGLNLPLIKLYCRTRWR